MRINDQMATAQVSQKDKRLVGSPQRPADIYRIWVPPIGLLSGRGPGEHMAMIPGNSIVKIPTNINTRSITNRFFEVVRNMLPELRSDDAKLRFLFSEDRSYLDLRLTASIGDRKASEVLDQVSVEILVGIENGWLLRK